MKSIEFNIVILFHTFFALRRNRILLNGKLQINFNKPYSFLFNLPAEARAIGPSEAAKEALNLQWWCVLNEARTFFEQNIE
jgi:hypothetical protein